MSINLVVELYGTRVGALRSSEWWTADLTFTGEALSRWSVNSPVLSVAAPLEVRHRRSHADRRRNVLAEMLPEGTMRERLARIARVATDDVAGMVTRFGRDVADAAQIYDPDSPWEPPVPDLVPVDDGDVARLFDELALGNDPWRGRTSLAGVQPKIVLARADGRWHQPVGGAPSTHIIKPAPADRPSTLAEEEYGHRLAAALGLTRTTVELSRLSGRECLVIQRYDRDGEARIHQEDFNQALGLTGEQKYQEYGGGARLSRVADVVARFCPQDLDRLVAQVTLAVAIGNLDLHAKNLGLLHPDDSTTCLVPAYYMVPMAHVPGIDGRLALAVDGEYRLSGITGEHLEREVSSWGAAPSVVDATLQRLRTAVQRETPPPAANPVRDRIATSTDRLLAGAPIGNAFTG